MPLFRVFRHGLSEAKFEIAAALIISLMIGAAFLGLALIIEVLTARVLMGLSVGHGLLILLLLAGAIIGLIGARAVLTQRIYARLVVAQQTALIKHLLSLPLDVIRSGRGGAIASGAVSFTDVTLTLLIRLGIRLVELVPLGLAGWVWIFPLSIILIGMIIPLWIVLYRRARLRYLLAYQLHEMAITLFQAIGKLRTLHAVEPILRRWSVMYQRDRSVVDLFPILSIGFAVFPLFALAYIEGIHADISALIIMALYALGLTGGLKRITYFLTVLPNYTELLALVAEAEKKPSISPEPTRKGGIVVADVAFRYHREASAVLDGLSFEVARGEHVALVGASGAGKSTLIKLLVGIECPERGTVHINGLNIAQIHSPLEQIGVVLQHSRLSAGSIRANINGFTRRPIDSAWRAARLANLEEIIRGLTMNMHTLLDEDAKILSRGQAQRLLIARAVVHEPHILIFDEAMSALDDETQATILANLRPYTLLFTTHRLSSLRRADRILVLVEGRIVEQGTWDELMAQQGVFAVQIAPKFT